MNAWTYALNSFKFHWRVNLAVILGASIATAVLAGALIVGDSVTGSLRQLAVERLGRIDVLVTAEQFFSENLAERTKQAERFDRHFSDAIPIILMPQAAAQTTHDDKVQRASNVNLIGCTDEFWNQNTPTPLDISLSGRSVVINQTMAERLNASEGDEILIRFGKVSNVGADSPLADKSDLARAIAELKIVRIIPTEGLGRFGLNPSQNLPLNAYLPLPMLQDALEQEGKINTLLITSSRGDAVPPRSARNWLTKNLRPTIADADVILKHVHRTYLNETNNKDETAYEYFNLSTDRMVFPDSTCESILAALEGLTYQTVFTYLANSISSEKGEKNEIPYSTISAIDSNEQLGPLFNENGSVVKNLADDEIVLNRWAADDLRVYPDDEIQVSFFEPETTHGQTKERTVSFRLRAISPLVAPLIPYKRNQEAKYVDKPAWTNDPDLTPVVAGITDKDSIENWDAPFPFDYQRIVRRKPKDDDYWDAYRTTPKAFVSMAAGKKLWSSRYGHVTSIRIATNGTNLEDISSRIETAVAEAPEQFGFHFIHAKADGIRAATGTTPFSGLFIGFSFFIMASAIGLVALLFRLNVEQRAGDQGLLLAVGVSRWKLTQLILSEGLLLGLTSAFFGVCIAVLYAATMIAGLRTYWVRAVVTPFLSLHLNVATLFIGGLIGIIVTVSTILWTIFGMRRLSIRQLMAGQTDETSIRSQTVVNWKRQLPAVFFAIAFLSGMAGVFLSGEAQAGAFFSCGASVLTAALILTRQWLRRSVSGNHFEQAPHFDELDLVVKNAARNSGRSTLTIGLMASACFLIIAISAFRLAPTSEGAAGFDLVATSEIPIFEDLNDPQVRQDVLGPAADALSGASVLAFRFQAGEDASCRNLYQTQRPRLLGVTPQIIEHFDGAESKQFKFAGVDKESLSGQANPWHLLENETAPGEPIPIILDKNTAMFSLHQYGGVGSEFELNYGSNQVIRFRIAGLLSNSVLQGFLICGEKDLLNSFPTVDGYRYFLVDTDDSNMAESATVLEDVFSSEGLDTVPTQVLLDDLLAVQNTYISTFQSLGGLGLLLGTFGLMAVQLRNVWQRRSEIALLKATGFSQYRIRRLVLFEHSLLLLCGLGIGTVAALLTVLPHIVFGGASIPFAATFMMLLVVVLVGLATGLITIWRVGKLPMLKSLRSP